MFELGNRVKCKVGKNKGKVGFVYNLVGGKKPIYVAFADSNGYYAIEQLKKRDNNRW